MNIQHSKIKNTGILFEILIRKMTADTLSGVPSQASKIIKKYFSNTEMGKEYKLYETILKYKNVKEDKAGVVLQTVLESAKKLNRTRLKKEKYNIIKEIKENYDINELFGVRIANYKTYASLYTLLEIMNSESNVNPTQIVENKLNLIEYMSETSTSSHNKKDTLMEEFKSYDKDIRTLTYRILLEKFNSKYSEFSPKQKTILKEFINSLDSNTKLKEFYNAEVNYIKKEISESIKNIKDTAVKIKLVEISKIINELDKKTSINNDHLVDLLQYHGLLEELKNVK